MMVVRESITMSELNNIFKKSGKIKNIFTKGKFCNITLYAYGPTSFDPGSYLKTERNRRVTSEFYRYLANRKCKDLISKYEDDDTSNNQSELTSRISSEMDNFLLGIRTMTSAKKIIVPLT